MRRDYAREAIGTASGKQVYGLKPKAENNITITVADKDKAIDKLSDTIKTKKLEFVFGKNYDKIGTLENYDKLSPKEKEKEVCAYVVRNGILSEREHIVVTDTKGNIIKTAEGNYKNATISISNARKKSIILTHNHSSNSTFSKKDIVTINENACLKRIQAVGHNGYLYKLEVPQKKEVETKMISDTFNNLKRVAEKKYLYDFNTRKINVNEYNNLIDDYIINNLVKKFGWKYEKSEIKWQ